MRTEPGGHRAAATDRIAWVDFARGLCVLAVVLTHVATYHYEPVVSAAAGLAAVVWAQANDVLGLVRMPALVMISGWLAAGKISNGLGAPKTRESIATNAYLYVVWLAVYAGITVLLGGPRVVPEAVRPGGDFVRQLIAPDTTLWFIYGLATYVLVMSLLRRLPAPAVMAASFVVGWAAHRSVPGDAPAWVRILELSVFFAIGVGARSQLVRAAGNGPLAVAAAAVAVLAYLVLRSSPPVIWYPLYVAGCVAGALAVLGLARFLAERSRRLSDAGAWVGRRTLGIYVLHFPFVMLLAVLEAALWADAFSHVIHSPLGRWTYPLVTTAVIVGACLLLDTGLRRAGASFLFALPTRLRRAVHGDRALTSR